MSPQKQKDLNLKANQPHETPCHLLCSTSKLETQLQCHDKMLAKLGKYVTCVTDRPTCLDQEQPGVSFFISRHVSNQAA